MINFKNGLNYNDFIGLGTSEEISMNLAFYKNSPIHKKECTLSSFNTLNIAVFSLRRCKDAATVSPILLELTKNNPNFNIKFFDREIYSDTLLKLANTNKVPSILVFDKEFNLLDTYIEFPSVVSKEISTNKHNKDYIISNFRNNIYFEDTLHELIKLLF